jgi:hypothetical protein
VRPLAAIAVLLATSTCGNTVPPPQPPPCAPTEVILPLSLPFGTVGRPLTVPLQFGLICDAGVPGLADITIAGPDNNPVDFDGGPAAVVGQRFGVQTSVTFTPLTPGPYHLVARHTILGLAQSDVLVAEDHTADAPALRLDAGALDPCTHVDLTPHSLLLCLEPSRAVFAADGERLQTFDFATTAAYADGVLWLTDNQELSRWIEGTQSDGGPGFVRSPDAGLSLPTLQPHLLPNADGVVVYSPESAFQRITLGDGGLAVTGVAPTGPGYIAWSDENSGVTLGMQNMECAASFDAGSEGCVLQPPGSAVGVDRGGLWMLGTPSTFGAMPALVVVTPGQSASLAAPADAQAETTVPFLWESAPSVLTDGGRFVPSFADRQFSLSAFPAGGTFVSATGTAVTLQDASGLRIYAR